MISTADALKPIFEHLNGSYRFDGQAQIFAFTSPFSQVGTSYIAREFAILSAQHYAQQGGRVALIDFDINNQSHAAYFDTPKTIAAYGALSGPYDATFGQMPYWRISPDEISHNGGRAQGEESCALWMVGEMGLTVSKFAWDTVKPGQSVHISRSQDYWQAMRPHFSQIIVDCPSFEKTDITLNVIPDADKTLIVSPVHRQTDTAHESVIEKISQAGGHCGGMILNEGMPAQQFASVAT